MSIAAHLLRLRDPATGQPLSDERLLPELAVLFVAGHDTTAHTMAWTLVSWSGVVLGSLPAGTF